MHQSFQDAGGVIGWINTSIPPQSVIAAPSPLHVLIPALTDSYVLQSPYITQYIMDPEMKKDLLQVSIPPELYPKYNAAYEIVLNRQHHKYPKKLPITFEDSSYVVYKLQE